LAGVLLGYSVAVWALGRWIAPPADLIGPPSRRRLALGVSLALAVLFLVLAKYYEFLRASVATVLAAWGSDLPWPVLDMVAPVGVSFFTFQAITYLVSAAQPGAGPRSLGQVLLFLGFWPTLFAGPILRAETFFAQVDAGRFGRPHDAWRALYLILLGLAQKLVCASWLAETFADPVFRYPEQHTGLAVLAGMVGYALQIFLDFSGYTLIVTGLGLLLGFELPLNFQQPYLARNLQGFWQRWHMSLSSFIRDYVYIPLGGSQCGWARTQVHVMAAMLISGAWHGANWTFIVWGALHGLGMVAFNLWRHHAPPAWRVWPAWLARGLTLCFVTLAWLFFRADSMEQASLLLSQLPGDAAHWLRAGDMPVHWLVMFTGVFFWFSRHASTLERCAVRLLQTLGPIGAVPVLSALLWLLIQLGPDGVPSFIYYRF
jgi:D-alanyl-lipoteichoic acid acyltransferase DltB (MBOAT superfamily)